MVLSPPRAAVTARAPGPRGRDLVRFIRWGRRDPLETMLAAAATYGDVTRVDLGGSPIFLVRGPEAAQEVLVSDQASYVKGGHKHVVVRELLGDGLLPANGEVWARHRRLLQPFFAGRRLGVFTDAITAAAARTLDTWTPGPLAVDGAMSELALDVVGSALFGAGHETTAAALTWMWYLLARHREARDRMYAEIGAVLGGRPPQAADVGRLPWTTAVIEEALRLYPPVWIVDRVAATNTRIAGFDVPAGSMVLISAYLNHRDPRYWPEPDRFDPGRFLGERAAGRPRLAYLPFGHGPRICIGARFAMLETVLITAMTAQRYRLDLPAGHRIRPDPAVTLRPRGGPPCDSARPDRHPGRRPVRMVSGGLMTPHW